MWSGSSVSSVSSARVLAIHLLPATYDTNLSFLPTMQSDVPIRCSVAVVAESWQWCIVELVLEGRAYPAGIRYKRSL